MANRAWLPAETVAASKRLVGFLLWLVVIVAVGVQAVSVLTPIDAPVWPAIVVLVFATAGFWMLRQERLQQAIALVNACFFIAAAIPVLLYGADYVEFGLVLFFVPVALAGVVQKRLHLVLTTLASVAVVYLSLVLHAFGFLPPVSGPSGQPGLLAAVEFTLAICIVALVLDRFATGIRLALDEALERESELKRMMQERQEVNRQLNDERNFSRAIIDSLPGVFFVLDPDGQIARRNEFFRTATGYSEPLVSEMALTDFLPPDEVPKMETGLRNTLDTGSGTAMIQLLHSDGHLIPHLFHAGRFEMSGRPYLVILGFDISELESARRDIEALNRQLAERIGRLSALIELDSALSSSLGLADVLSALLARVRSHLKVDAAAVLQFDRSSTRLRWKGGSGFRSAGLQETSLQLGEGIAGRAALTREAQLVSGQELLRGEYARWTLIEDEGFEFYAAMPLVAKGELEGILELFHRSPLQPDQDWRDFLAALAGLAALVFNSARLLASLEQSNVELRRAYDTTIEGWSRALDLRDHETEGHSQRVTDLTIELARRMGAPEDRLVHVRRGALLHDIGKMGVPDSILRKPGPLSESEREQMQRHTTYAFELLRPIEFLQPALKIPYSHHENWDGSGYPQGLKGTDIPLAARVFSVVDVYDALTSDRPYRPAWSAEQALGHIREQSGRKFDPEVVEQFLKMMAESGD